MASVGLGVAEPAPVTVEICIDDVEGALFAEQEGAQRIELCAGLSEGGVTPSLGLVRTVLEHVRRIGVQVMIRPRGGDFSVSPLELDVMLADIAAIRTLHAAPDVVVGFVFGVLTDDFAVDERATARLKAACGRAPVTFHKAFDAVHDKRQAFDRIAALGIDRVLTSGGNDTAEAGCAVLADLVRRGMGRIGILAGGGVRVHNARAIVDRTGVHEIHLRAMDERHGRPPSTSRQKIAAVLRAVGTSP